MSIGLIPTFAIAQPSAGLACLGSAQSCATGCQSVPGPVKPLPYLRWAWRTVTSTQFKGAAIGPGIACDLPSAVCLAGADSSTIAWAESSTSAFADGWIRTAN